MASSKRTDERQVLFIFRKFKKSKQNLEPSRVHGIAEEDVREVEAEGGDLGQKKFSKVNVLKFCIVHVCSKVTNTDFSEFLPRACAACAAHTHTHTARERERDAAFGRMVATYISLSLTIYIYKYIYMYVYHNIYIYTHTHSHTHRENTGHGPEGGGENGRASDKDAGATEKQSHEALEYLHT